MTIAQYSGTYHVGHSDDERSEEEGSALAGATKKQIPRAKAGASE